MTFFPVHHYQSSANPLDRFFGDQLHLFDPWHDSDALSEELDQIPESFRWINAPQRILHTSNQNEDHQHFRPSHQAEKFRVQLNVAGYNPHSIKTHIEDRKVIVEAKQEERQPDGDFYTQEMRKTYVLPEHADANHVASYITPHHILVIEAPIINPEKQRLLTEAKSKEHNLAQFGEHRDPQFDYGTFLSSPFQPCIVDDEGKKELELTMPMLDCHPDQIKLSVKNNNLIVQTEHRSKDTKNFERSFFFQTVTLPPGTQTKQLRSHLTLDGQLKINAPFEELKPENAPEEEKKE